MSNEPDNSHQTPPRSSFIDRTTDALARSSFGMIGFAIFLLMVSIPLLLLFISVPLSLKQQIPVTVAFLLLAMIISVLFPRLRLLVMLLSITASFRYIWWRGLNTLSLDSTWGDWIISLLLFGAEIYGVVVLVLGYFQTLELNLRQPEPLPPNQADWPTVDVFIPTYNEDTEILRRTVTGAMAINYPKKTVYLLDDGRRDSMRALAEELGCEYIIRPDNKHAKAGNLNHAMTKTHGEFIAILDADHVPVMSFLQETVGFFKDPNVALVQTPHHFYNPDPFERNLNVAGQIAPEGDFFYHVVQVGNDFWNSAFFCGSAGVIRRTVLQQIGGIATETVTEDAHTSMRIHAGGYRSIYYSKPLIAGLATERFAFHVAQRIRWARGMVQILRVQNPLWTKGLKLPQRLNYFNAMLHFLFGVPRLIFILAPMTYLLFGLHPVKGLGLEVLLYALPHIALATIATSMVSRSFRHAFWAEVYESAIATYVGFVTLLALISPKFGTFNVTSKGGFIEEKEFDWKHASPTIVLIVISLISLLVLVPIRWFLKGPEHSSIAINAVWTLYNLVILIAAALVAWERPQQRRSPRLPRRLPCTIFLPTGEGVSATTSDLSETGARITIDRPIALPKVFTIQIDSDFAGSAMVDCHTSWRELGSEEQMVFGVEFEAMDYETKQELIRLMFSGPDSWIERTIPADRPFRSYWYILTSSYRTMEERKIDQRTAPRLSMALPCKVVTPSGRVFAGTTENLSETGAGVLLDGAAWPLPQEVHLQLSFRDGVELDLSALTVRPELMKSGQLLVGLVFENIPYQDQRLLAQRIYGGQLAPTFKAEAPARRYVSEGLLPVQGAPITVTNEPAAPRQNVHDTGATYEPPGFERTTESRWERENEPTRLSERSTGPVEYSEPISIENAPTYNAPLPRPHASSGPLQMPPIERPRDMPVERLEAEPVEYEDMASSVEDKIVANRRIGVYYVPGGDYYNQMLQSSQRGGSNWIFFDSEEEAQAAGYHRPRAMVQPSRPLGDAARRPL